MQPRKSVQLPRDYSDAVWPAASIEDKILRLDDTQLLGAFKTSGLRGVSQRPPFMHNGKVVTMHDMLKHYNDAPTALFGTSELTHPLKLTELELSELEAFLKTLNVSAAAE